MAQYYAARVVQLPVKCLLVYDMYRRLRRCIAVRAEMMVTMQCPSEVLRNLTVELFQLVLEKIETLDLPMSTYRHDHNIVTQ